MAETRAVVTRPPTRPADDLPSKAEMAAYLAAMQGRPGFGTRNFVRQNPEVRQMPPRLRIGGKVYK
jgi:hypothetical protein